MDDQHKGLILVLAYPLSEATAAHCCEHIEWNIGNIEITDKAKVGKRL